jgi:hypothetical protein
MLNTCVKQGKRYIWKYEFPIGTREALVTGEIRGNYPLIITPEHSRMEVIERWVLNKSHISKASIPVGAGTEKTNEREDEKVENKTKNWNLP